MPPRPPKFELALLFFVTLLLFANMSAILLFHLLIIKILTFQKFILILNDEIKEIIIEINPLFDYKICQNQKYLF